LSESHPGLTGL